MLNPAGNALQPWHIEDGIHTNSFIIDGNTYGVVLDTKAGQIRARYPDAPSCDDPEIAERQRQASLNLPATAKPIAETLSARPVYPELAKVAHFEGNVWVRGVVGTDGSYSWLCVSKVDRPSVGFEAAALDRASAVRFDPATKDGVHVEAVFTYIVEFRLP